MKPTLSVVVSARAILPSWFRVRGLSEGIVRVAAGDRIGLLRAERLLLAAGWRAERRGWWVEAARGPLPPPGRYTLWEFLVGTSKEDGGRYLIPNEVVDEKTREALWLTHGKFLNHDEFTNEALHAFFCLEAVAGHFHESTPAEARKKPWADRFRAYRAPDWLETIEGVEITDRYRSGKYL